MCDLGGVDEGRFLEHTSHGPFGRRLRKIFFHRLDLKQNLIFEIVHYHMPRQIALALHLHLRESFVCQGLCILWDKNQAKMHFLSYLKIGSPPRIRFYELLVDLI